MKLAQLAVAASLLLAAMANAETKRALVIGIDTYQPAGTTAEHPAGCIYGRCELGSFENLQGSVNDAEAIANLLTSPKFSFPAANVALLTNPGPKLARPGLVLVPGDQTTHDGILAAMKKYLVDMPEAGDTVVFYDASHGSLRVNSKGSKLTVMVDGKPMHADSTLVPSDAYKGGFDVRDREMTRIFNAALDKGVHLTVIFDSCHSGGSTRGLNSYRGRSLAFDPRDIAEAPDPKQPAPTERAQNPALVFAAVQQDQQANESGDASTEAHGAFTAALVETLDTLPANAPASLVYRRVRAVLEGNGVPNQEPDLDATAARRDQPLFGAVGGSDTGKLRTAALQTSASGAVWLDIGRVSGIGVGTTFTSLGKDPVEVRVQSLEGMARSTAEVVSPAGAKVKPGEVFELKQWVPNQKPLLLWSAPAGLSSAEVQAAAAAVMAAGVATVADPAEEVWTDRLEWNGSTWVVLHAASTQAPTLLGPTLTAEALKSKLATGAKLWVNLPPSREMAASLELHTEGSAAQATTDRAQANYILSGTMTAKGPAYAWYHKAEFEAGPATNPKRHSPGCSTSSSYPVRTAWTETGATLNAYALRLAKVEGWLQLADTPGAAYADSYYKLAVSHTADGPAVTPEETVKDGDSLYLSLVSDAKIVDPRWVYVLDIDCQGNGSLLYPVDYSENRFPNTAGSRLRVPLAGARTIDVGAPYGMDTLVMLSTEQPLPDPEVLNFEGVGAAKSGARGLGGSTPLSQLLGEASTGTRGVHAHNAVPTNWSLDLMPLVSEAPSSASTGSKSPL